MSEKLTKESNRAETERVINAVCELKKFRLIKTKAEFFSKMGVSKGYLTDNLAKNCRISNDFIAKLLIDYPISEKYILNGVGEPIDRERLAKINPSAAQNIISNNSNNGDNVINTESKPESIDLLKSLLDAKDETIKSQQKAIDALSGEIEQLRAYVKLTSTKYIAVIEQMLAATNETAELVKGGMQRIGFIVNEKKDGKQV